ncbi:MAG: RNA methyltransferase [Oscillospiraceae bacterium]|nr:RNA methyltransferase [Oscillospiraceae bacterium]
MSFRIEIYPSGGAMVKITSKDNSVLKEYRKLCGSRKHRRGSGKFALEGVRLICDYAKSGGNIEALMVTEKGIERLGDAFENLSGISGKTLLLDDSAALTIAETESPQGVFAICCGSLELEGLPKSADNGIIMLCSLQDPGNVGTILRSAEAFGLSAVVMTSDCPDAASPKVLRASMGAAVRIPIYVATDAIDAINVLKQSGISVFAAALGERSVPVHQVSLKKSAVVIGNEGSGLSDEVADSCTGRVILPISEGSESLNAAMAATVFAWELKKAAGEADGGAKR